MSTNSPSTPTGVKLPPINNPSHSPTPLSDFKSPVKSGSRPVTSRSNRSKKSDSIKPDKEAIEFGLTLQGTEKWKFVERKSKRDARRLNLHSARSNQGSKRSFGGTGQSWKINSKENVTKTSGFNVNHTEANEIIHEKLDTIPSAQKEKNPDFRHLSLASELSFRSTRGAVVHS